ncbi:ABC transporter substrate-binding protein [Iodobacter sp. HSC-16F04]|uniref:ABC transporter substrate-binding protein n=1 Tax=Iodobacter violaceini TaxID=3044271 RepID=A0ABX0KX51_9NEIS|nr:ABC transporter substrate-binding protein [Iodobacter violacea]NHQ86624.1 ABC transporter substrate-binding protein [Iodobacter violacea]
MIKKLILIVLIISSVTGCGNKTLAQQRAEKLAEASKEVLIAVAWPLHSSKATLIDGINLAVDEVNQSGGVLGRKIKIQLRDDTASLSKGRLVAQEIADDISVAAVIGHLNSYIAAPAAQIYERAGLLLITPGASVQKITEQGGKYTFRSLPGNRDQGRQIADYAVTQGYKNIAIYYIKNDYGIDLANYFEQRAHELGITVADRRSYNMGGDNHAAILADWGAFLSTDAIFLIGSLPESAQILHEMRVAGLKVPVLGGAGLDSPELIRLGGKNTEGTVVFSLFNMGDPRPEVKAFGEQFKKKFGVLPDSTAAQGYDTVKLLVQAMQAADSVVPDKVASALRATKNWQGVTGLDSYSAKGDLVGKRLSKVVVREGKFEYFNIAPPK